MISDEPWTGSEPSERSISTKPVRLVAITLVRDAQRVRVPRATLDQTRERIASLASDVHTDPWLIDSAEDPAANPAIYVEIDTTGNVPEGLYRDWSPLELQALETAMGALPAWCVFCTVTGRIPGDAQIRAFVLELIGDGGPSLPSSMRRC